jgi:hypothetical protein
MCASHSGFEAHKGLEIRIRVPDRACEMRINGVWDVRRVSARRRSALFGPVLRFRKVCIMKLSHFRGSLHEAPTGIPQSEPLVETKVCTKNEGLEKR